MVRLLGDDDDALRALGRHLARDLVGGHAAVDLLPAGQRHRVVEVDAVGDVGAGDRGGADGEAAGVVVGAVADVLEDMAAGRERRLAHPVGAFRPHLGVALGLPVHALDHVVAADAGIGARAFGHDGAAVIGAAGAEIVAAGGDVLALGEHRLGLLQRRDPRLERRDAARAPAPARRWRWRCGWCRARPSTAGASCRSRRVCRRSPAGSRVP